HEVFGFITDFTNQPLWNHSVRSCTKDDPGPVVVGSRFTQVRQNDTQHFEVTQLVPYRIATIRFLPPLPPMETQYTLIGQSRSTVVTDEWHLSPEIEAGSDSATPVNGAVAADLASLQQVLETGVSRQVVAA
ncbi:MAG TPA: SRPBCC family protein, partial [Candidatus Sulfotelmatobacter sp.]|nr:SRPBCC family protein [Candidatus Sulfotelmatobacter sp.]